MTEPCKDLVHELLGPGESCKACGFVAPPESDAERDETALKLVGEFDASKWAAEFVRRYGGDEELMLAWFANAIMAGYDHARKPELLAAPRELAEAVARLTDYAAYLDTDEGTMATTRRADLRLVLVALADMTRELALTEAADTALVSELTQRVANAEAALAEAQRERDDARSEAKSHLAGLSVLAEKLADAQAEAAKLRAALDELREFAHDYLCECSVGVEPVNAHGLSHGHFYSLILRALAAPPSTAAPTKEE